MGSLVIMVSAPFVDCITCPAFVFNPYGIFGLSSACPVDGSIVSMTSVNVGNIHDSSSNGGIIVIGVRLPGMTFTVTNGAVNANDVF